MLTLLSGTLYTPYVEVGGGGGEAEDSVLHSCFLVFGPGDVFLTPAAKSWVGFVFTFRRFS